MPLCNTLCIVNITCARVLYIVYCTFYFTSILYFFVGIHRKPLRSVAFEKF
jgi:hypothetical protein